MLRHDKSPSIGKIKSVSPGQVQRQEVAKFEEIKEEKDSLKSE